jgi:hypothetical protein
VKFVADTMLGKLSKWLRILGYDTLYYPKASDEELLKIAHQEGRVLLTKDRLLSRHHTTRTFYVKSEDVNEQLKQVVVQLSLSFQETLGTRCPLCNTLLKEIDKEKVRGYVPEAVFETYHTFQFCSSCQKYYWLGSHWQNIKEKVKKLEV